MRCRILDKSSKTYGVVASTPEPMGNQQQKTGDGSRCIPTSHAENPLVAVMEFAPLKEAFGEFCSKALCSEVRQDVEPRLIKPLSGPGGICLPRNDVRPHPHLLVAGGLVIEVG